MLDQEGNVRGILSRRRIASQTSVSKADPLSRKFRRDIRPLRSKPLPRKVQKAIGKPVSQKKKNKDARPVGVKPEYIMQNTTYVENGWHVRGFYGIWTASRVNFAEHEIRQQVSRFSALQKV